MNSQQIVPIVAASVGGLVVIGSAVYMLMPRGTSSSVTAPATPFEGDAAYYTEGGSRRRKRSKRRRTHRK